MARRWPLEVQDSGPQAIRGPGEGGGVTLIFSS